MIKVSIRRALIIRLSSLGDIILTTPLLRGLKDYFPSLQVDYLVRKEYDIALRHNPYIDNILYYDGDYKGFLRKQIKQNKYDLILDLQNNLRTMRLTFWQNAHVLRFKKRSFDKFLLVNFKINRMKHLPPIADRYAETLDRYLIDGEGLDLFLPLNITSRIAPLGKYIIGFCPGSKHFTKRWQAEYFIELGNMLYKNGYLIAVFGGIEDNALCENIVSNIPGARNLSTENDLLQIAKDMKSCAAIVTNDSGLMHVACAMKVPVLAIFGSSVREFGFTPYVNKHIIVENNLLGCRPCSHIGKKKCQQKHFKCMREVSPEMVYKNLTRLLNHG